MENGWVDESKWVDLSRFESIWVDFESIWVELEFPLQIWHEACDNISAIRYEHDEGVGANPA